MKITEFNKRIRIDFYGCDCQKYRFIKYKGVVCEKCGVEVRSRFLYFDKQEFLHAMTDRQIIRKQNSNFDGSFVGSMKELLK
jgi:hypothetical protein